MNSAIYVGQLRHRRFRPVENRFRYRLYMMYLDLDELDRVFAGRWLWSTAAPNIAWFRRGDHLGGPDRDLAGAVRDLVEIETGHRPLGPVRLLTHLRYFGYCFNPVSFYYCFDEDARRIEAIVAEVNNTPWGERHCYVLPHAADADKTGHLRFRFNKRFHVSPYMEMDMDYDWRMTTPGESLAVHMQNIGNGIRVFDATMGLRRIEISGRSLAAILAAFPFMTLSVIIRIYYQALRLRLKRAPFHTHPKKLTATGVR